MTSPVPPDEYIGGSGVVGEALARALGIRIDQVGDYVAIVQADLPDVDWTTVIGPDTPGHLVPDLLRAIADQLDGRARRLMS